MEIDLTYSTSFPKELEGVLFRKSIQLSSFTFSRFIFFFLGFCLDLIGNIFRIQDMCTKCHVDIMFHSRVIVLYDKDVQVVRRVRFQKLQKIYIFSSRLT